MSDDTGKVPTPVAGGSGSGKGASDGVSDAPGKTSGGGESAGGAYPNDAAKGGEGGFMGHGGQSHEAYSGPGDEDDKAAGGDNAVSDD